MHYYLDCTQEQLKARRQERAEKCETLIAFVVVPSPHL